MTDYALSTENLAFAYARTPIIRELSLAVPKGQIYGFLGRNGAGKTTTIRMLMGMLKPDRGTLTVGAYHGRRVRPVVRKNIGYVSQEPHFYPWMTGHGLSAFLAGMYPNWSHAYVAELADALQVELEKRVEQMSGGTRMKLALCLSLGHRPDLLILDEPTSGVDPIARNELLTRVRAEVDRLGCSVFFSTHYIHDVEEVGDHVGILHDGRLLYQGAVSGALEFAGASSLEEAFITLTGDAS